MIPPADANRAHNTAQVSTLVLQYLLSLLITRKVITGADLQQMHAAIERMLETEFEAASDSASQVLGNRLKEELTDFFRPLHPDGQRA